MWYISSASNDETGILSSASSVLHHNCKSNNGPRTIAQAFTGTHGIKFKAIKIDAMTSYGDLSKEPVVDDNYDYNAPRLRKIHILIATSAGNARVSSNWLMVAKHKGFPASLYNIMQELGR